MSTDQPCAATGCTNTVVRRHGPGRPAIYCSPACRPSNAGRARAPFSVEVDQLDGDGEHDGRPWVVRLSRKGRSVEIGNGLGRFSAVVLAAELRELITDSPKQRGEAFD